MDRFLNMEGLSWDSSIRVEIVNALHVTKLNSQLELLENNMSYVDVIDDNGNIIIHHDKTFPTLAQGFIVKAKRTWLRTLKDIAAYNLAKNTSSESDAKILKIPYSLNVLVTKFLDTYSGDHRTA